MKNSFAVFALLCALFFAVSCDSGIKFDNPNDIHSDAYQGNRDQNTPDDDSEPTDDSEPSSDTEPDEQENPDTTPNTGDTAPDNGDTTPDGGDTVSDNSDSEPDKATDSSDTADDGDTTDPDITDTGAGIGETRVHDCSELPENAVYNTVSAIVQSWDGEKWVPSSKTSFNLEGSEDECRFKCKTNYNWNDSLCAAATKTAYCQGKPENTEWNDSGRNGTFMQTWNGGSWMPANHKAVYSKTAGECTFVCVAGYIWNNNTCETAPTQSANCTGLPVNAQWNTVSSITQTYDGETWYPSTEGVYDTNPSTSRCRYKCASGYDWSGNQCVITAEEKCYAAGGNWNASQNKCTKTANCPSKPANSEWNDGGKGGKFTQNWNGTSWTPASHTTTYSTTAGECAFICATGYLWDGVICDVAPTQTANCTGLPAEGAAWNTATSITQTWDGEKWTPSETGTYNETESTTECRFKCLFHYKWKNNTCVADTKNSPCMGLPENAQWNTATSIKQTWNGSTWTPSTTGTYNETASESECRFKCNTTYFWDGSECTNPCDYEPCEEVANSTKICTASAWNEYSCGCTTGYRWKNTSCVGTLGSICTGQTSCYNASSSITCPTSPSGTDAEYNFFGQDAQYTSKCTAQSFTVSSNVVVDNNTGLTWEKSPSTDTYTWANRKKHCNELNSLNYAGKNNWRVPNPLEFLTIVDNSAFNPATNSNFTGMPTENSTYMWTNNEFKGNTTTDAYTFNLSYGTFFSSNKTNTYKILCVSGDELVPATSSDFAKSGRIITDNRTGLMWQGENNVSRKTWQEALKYCEDLSYAGYSDWRLPNKNELASLVNYEKSEYPYSYIQNINSVNLWSSSTFMSETDKAWSVEFSSPCYVSGYSKTRDSYFRCVRNAE